MHCKKVAIIPSAFLFGGLFNFFNIPAGWLLGSLFTGILFSVSGKRIESTKNLFKIGLALIGAGIGISIDASFLGSLKNFILPLLISIPLTLFFSLLLAEILFRGSNLDYKTSLLSCTPGGASEVIGISREVGANEQITAAFHTARIILFVLCIPLIVGATREFHSASNLVVLTELLAFNIVEIISVLMILLISFYLSKFLKIPVGTLIYAILIGFLVNQFFNLGPASTVLPVLGQVIIGSVIGQKFDMATVRQFKQVGLIGVKIIFLLFSLSLITALIFSMLSGLSYASSLLGTVPAGAAEMSSTALSLNLDPSTIVALQTLRLLVIFSFLPILIAYADKREERFQTRNS